MRRPGNPSESKEDANVSDASGQYTITLRRVWLEELLGQAWIRTWKGDGKDVPEWFSHGLKAARPCLGYGVIDPLELRIDGSQMGLISAGSGRTLAEYLSGTFVPEGESFPRFLTEQICFGLLRVHEGLETIHGALTPFNIQLSDKYNLNLWALPAARLELSWGKIDREWETPYRSPQVQEGKTPTVADDIYSLGMIFARLLFGRLVNFQAWLEDRTQTLGASQQTLEILKRSTDPDRRRRYKSLREMVLSLNPESALGNLNIKGGAEECKRGLEAFRKEQTAEAREHFQEALCKDWLSLPAHNNFAVTEALLKGWPEAREPLEKAYKVFSHHPVLDTNWGLCVCENEDLNSAEFWLERANGLNPGFVQPLRVLGRRFKEAGAFQKALGFAQQCLAIKPRCRESRLLMAGLLETVGNAAEAACHRDCAKQLPMLPNLFDHLISPEGVPPWTLYLKNEDETVLRRLKNVEYNQIIRTAQAHWRKPKIFEDRSA